MQAEMCIRDRCKPKVQIREPELLVPRILCGYGRKECEDDPGAVSYTHLDVYKRQIQEYIKNQLEEDLANDQISLKEYMDPVSYTHLDVYKRQAHAGAGG